MLYVFYEIRDLVQHRALFESVFRLPMIEIEPHLPHHRHGVVKYDAGPIIISLNLSAASRFRHEGSDALITVFGADPPSEVLERARNKLGLTARAGLFTDLDGHHWEVTSANGLAGSTRPILQELRLRVRDLHASVSFYAGVMGLEIADWTATGVRIATSSVPIFLEPGYLAVDGSALRNNTYLIVFHAPDIAGMRAKLSGRGLAFKGRHIGSSDIGSTIRFEDPSGHRLCLYEPSAESLTWGSGPKLKELVELGSKR